MTKIDLDELERKARAATQEGLWKSRVPDRGGGIEGVIVETEDGRQIAEAFDSTPWSEEKCIANGEHIAAASPPVVLALIARIRELKDALGMQCERLDNFHETYTKVAKDPLNVREILERGAVLP